MKNPDHNLHLPAISSFSASIAPINRVNTACFGVIDRICCATVFAMALMLIRLLAK